MRRIMEYLKDRLTGKAPKGAKRDPRWPEFRADFIKENPRCAVCKRTDRLQVHHKIPFHVAPELELDRRNVVVLCARRKVLNCHLIFGHLGNFRRINPFVDADIAEWGLKLDK